MPEIMGIRGEKFAREVLGKKLELSPKDPDLKSKEAIVQKLQLIDAGVNSSEIAKNVAEAQLQEIQPSEKTREAAQKLASDVLEKGNLQWLGALRDRNLISREDMETKEFQQLIKNRVLKDLSPDFLREVLPKTSIVILPETSKSPEFQKTFLDKLIYSSRNENDFYQYRKLNSDYGAFCKVGQDTKKELETLLENLIEKQLATGYGLLHKDRFLSERPGGEAKDNELEENIAEIDTEYFKNPTEEMVNSAVRGVKNVFNDLKEYFGRDIVTTLPGGSIRSGRTDKFKFIIGYYNHFKDQKIFKEFLESGDFKSLLKDNYDKLSSTEKTWFKETPLAKSF